jgi:hypothetical protein
MNKERLVINAPENSTTSSMDHTDRSLMSKRVRALLHDKEGSELLFLAIENERNNVTNPDVELSSELIERLNLILSDENDRDSENPKQDKKDAKELKKSVKTTYKKEIVNEHTFFNTVLHFFGVHHTKSKATHKL